MQKSHKTAIKLNLVSLFFIAVSMISVTLAWFAYSGLAKVETEINVKTWYIEFEKNNETVSNNMIISLNDIHPGMETVHETVKILNKGDSDAQISYSIVSASILNESYSSDNLPNDELKDMLSHNYPFNINVSLSNKYAKARDGECEVDVSISWPLDSGNDEFDSSWGNSAYQYQQNESNKAKNDSNYNPKPSIKVVLSVKAEQYIDSPTSMDTNYKMGDLILYDISSDSFCDQLSDTCIRTHVIDVDNKNEDETVKLLPDLFSTYTNVNYYNKENGLPNWNVDTQPLELNDLLKVIAQDVKYSTYTGDGLSEAIIGYVNSNNRIANLKAKVSGYNGMFKIRNESYPYLATNKCYWLADEYNNEKAYALTKIDNTHSKIYGNDKINECMYVPVIIATK